MTALAFHTYMPFIRLNPITVICVLTPGKRETLKWVLFTNRVNPDKMRHHEAFPLSLHCLLR